MCSCKSQRPKKHFLKLLNDQGMNYYLNLCKSICKLGPTFCSLYRRLLFRWQIVPFGIPNNTPFITINIIAQTIEHFLLSLKCWKKSSFVSDAISWNYRPTYSYTHGYMRRLQAKDGRSTPSHTPPPTGRVFLEMVLRLKPSGGINKN